VQAINAQVANIKLRVCVERKGKGAAELECRSMQCSSQLENTEIESTPDGCPPYRAAALIGKEALRALNEVAVARLRKVAKRHAKPDAVQLKNCDFGVKLRRPLPMWGRE